MSLLGLILLIVILFAVLPTWPYSREWGYRPVSIVSVILLVLIVLLLTRSGGAPILP
ncbi:DUF3309 family protein [Legionella dresdenensis]|uniref:DUF3309 family protein n=1 Tax=Legionella dresdenensis TaxID=450200 RepID=A0ABV8CDS6_9GAMM